MTKRMDGLIKIENMDGETLNIILSNLFEGDAGIMVEKGYILFCTQSGQVVKVKANTLGNGIKRLMGFFKDLKKTLNDEEGMGLAGYIEERLKKHEIDLEGL